MAVTRNFVQYFIDCIVIKYLNSQYNVFGRNFVTP